jgi:hypothetical protein
MASAVVKRWLVFNDLLTRPDLEAGNRSLGWRG